MRIFRDLVESGDATRVAQVIDVARTSPTATRLLLQLEATTTGDRTTDLSISFLTGRSSYFDSDANQIVLSRDFMDSPYALVSLLGQEGTHALHAAAINATARL